MRILISSGRLSLRVGLAFYLLPVALILLLPFCSMGQYITRIPLSKPATFRDKALRSERTGEDKASVPLRLYHGMVTHYNYYYNAQTKLSSIIQKAQLARQNDYTQLLPYYDYSVTETSADSLELDSVISKATAGIVLHDLRNSYIDDQLMLIGQAYFLWDKLDSAYRIFQYINYQFYPKAKDEYNIVIGSTGRATKGNLRVSTPEKKGILRKAFSRPPGRNDALLWMARTYAEGGLHDEAVSLVHVLKKDPSFPKRLQLELDDVLAYSFYQQERWDSAAFYLNRSLSLADNKTQLARKEFLLAQLYTLNHDTRLASQFFNRAKTHTTDPAMLIHARLYNAMLVKDSSRSDLQTTLNELLKLTKKERFDGYESLLYYSAADVALLQKDTSLAYSLLQKSIRYDNRDDNGNNTGSTRNKAFLKLGQLALQQGNFLLAASSYDSLDLQDPQLQAYLPEIEKTKPILQQLATHIKTVIHEDSLQRIAAMPEQERETYLRNLLKRLRKEKGLKEDAVPTGITAGNGQSSTTPTIPDLFQSGNTGGWYFNVNNQRTKGINDFKNKWGNRPNQDNWRRQAAIDASITQSNNAFPGNPGGEGDIDNPQSVQGTAQAPEGEQELSIEGLKYFLPLSPEQLDASNQKIYQALFTQGLIFKNQLEDHPRALKVFEELLKRFPISDSTNQVLFELYYCSLKTGDQQKAQAFLNRLNASDTSGIWTAKTKPGSINDPSQETKIISTYQEIYELYVAGRFEQARKKKILADSSYGTSHWTPQLLYVEAVYFANQKNDSLALLSLGEIFTRFGNHPMAEKAAILKDVITRRKEIEQHLRESNIVRVNEPKLNIPPSTSNPVPVAPTVTKKNEPKDSTKTAAVPVPVSPKPVPVPTVSKKDSTGIPTAPTTPSIPVTTKPITTVDTSANTVQKPPSFTKASDSCYLAYALIDVYPIYRNECLTALETYLKQTPVTGKTTCSASLKNGNGNYGWILIAPSITVSDCDAAKEQLTKAMPQLFYWMPAGKIKLVRLNASRIRELEETSSLEEFQSKINDWIK